MKFFAVFLVVVLVVSSVHCTAAAEDQTEAQLKLLQQQVAQQAALIEALQDRLDDLEKAQETPAAPVPTAPAAASATEPATVAPEKPALRGRYPMELYGYVKIDAAHDSAGTTNGNTMRWVDPENVGRDDDQFALTARQTRLGLKIFGPESFGAETEGRVEVDFYGDGTENNPELRMRYAYVSMDWPEDNTQLLFGQTWDLISPLIPRTLNFTNLWWTGNSGFRRPQIRATKTFGIGEKGNLELALALTRNIGDVNTRAFGEDTGADTGFPSIQGRAVYYLDGPIGRETTLGISGHFGQEEFDFTNFTGGSWRSQTVDSWSVHAESIYALTPKLLLTGEVFTGANMDAYTAGIGQGVVVVPFDDGRFNYAREIRTRGGWASLEIGPYGKWRYTLGGGMEDPDDSDLLPGARSKNVGFYGNALYAFSENIELGVELAHWRTSYLQRDDASNLRLQTSATFKF
ncbi:MAG: hypothetical protein JNK74_18135 [Candidatus Hydrogenedentes bacterium]|nr:hypothetical protein [Candidatus Hydrogenedentota bacterium]